jgi:hypothetical protein
MDLMPLSRKDIFFSWLAATNFIKKSNTLQVRELGQE